MPVWSSSRVVSQVQISRAATTRGKGPGKLRHVVEQTLGPLHQFRRLAVRWERHLDIHNGFADLACALICWRCLIKWRAD
jgi:transposase